MSLLAIDGGPPVRTTMLPYGRQWVDEDDIDEVAKVLRSDWLTTGPAVAEFEEAFASYVGARHAVALSSGTAALHAAASLFIGRGDEAIVSPITFVASANCVLYQGGHPVFADVQLESLNIDPVQISRLIGERTKAIIPVDYAGQPVDLEEITGLAEGSGLAVIEDACHALGASYRGRRVGQDATVTVFSTHPVKHVTTGEGGVITTNDPELAKRIRLFRNHGITSEGRERQFGQDWLYEMVSMGFNYRLTDFACVLGLSQLRRLDAWLERRRAIAHRYETSLNDLAEISLPSTLPDREHAWHIYVIRLNLDLLRVGRAEIFRALRAENINVNVHYIPVPWHPFYKDLGYERGRWPIAETEYERLITLPLFPAMSDADVEDVVTAVRKVVGAYRR